MTDTELQQFADSAHAEAMVSEARGDIAQSQRLMRLSARIETRMVELIVTGE